MASSGNIEATKFKRPGGGKPMPLHAKSLFVLAVAAMAIAAPADAQTLKQVATIPIPGTPINQFGVLAIDQDSGLGYLADKDNKGVVVFDTRTDKYVSRIGGFVGMAKSGNSSGPNGVVVVNGGAELWVSDGDSSITVIDTKSGEPKARIITGGKARANAMAFDPNTKVVIVANSNEETPVLSLISTEPGHKIVATIAIPDSAENLERSAYHAPSGMFYTVIPVSRADKTKGLLAQTDPKSGRLVKLHEIERCHPHSLSIVTDQTIFMGCSNTHGAAPQPGGDMAIFDIATGTVTGHREGLGGNGGSTVNLKLGQYYHATTHGALVVVDIKTGTLVQKLPTPPEARSLGVSLATGRVYLATTAKHGPCGGCIQIFAPE
jgi:DNA-binding beta-propeller fold protein YncE